MSECLKASIHSLVIYPAIACFLAVGITRICIDALPKIGFLDLPDARRVHLKPTPRAGGIAIILAFFLTSTLYVVRHPDYRMGPFILGFALPAAAIIAAGLLDDRFSLPSRIKLMIQILAGILVWVVGARFKYILSIELPDVLALPLTILWVVTIVNAFNLIDGMDGVAAGLGFLSAACLGIWSGLLHHSAGLVAVAGIFAGSCAGFLRYNFSPARIFMGDTGSMFLGLFFAYAGLSSFGKPATLTSLLIPVLAVGVPLVDVTLAFWRRLVRKLLEPNASGIMTADMNHLHHRILKKVCNQRKAALYIYLLACLLAGMGFATLLFERTIPALGYIVLLIIMVVVVRRVAGLELYDSARLLENGLARPRKLIIILLLIPVADLLVLFGSYVISRKLLDFGQVWEWDFWPGFACLAIPVMLFILGSGNYRVLWIRAGYVEFRGMFIQALAGLLVGECFYVLFLHGFDAKLLPTLLLLFALLVIVGFGTIRLFLIYVGMHMMWSLRQQSLPGQKKIRILLYGGGLNTALYLGYTFGQESSEALDFVGIVDDDPALAGMRVFGLPVLGRGTDLERILSKHPVDRIVFTMQTDPTEKENQIRELAEQAGIAVRRFRTEEFHIANSGGKDDFFA